MEKTRIFHSYSSSEAVLLSQFGKWCTETESQMQEGDTDCCGLGHSRGSEIHFFFLNELSWEQRNSQSKLFFPTSMDIFLFSPKFPTCPAGCTGWNLQHLHNPRMSGGTFSTWGLPSPGCSQSLLGRNVMEAFHHNLYHTQRCGKPKLQKSMVVSRAGLSGQEIFCPLSHVMERAQV